MKLYIKYKSGRQHTTTVQAALDKLGLPNRIIGPGTAEIQISLTPDQLAQLKVILSKSGMDLVDGKKARLIEKIKNVIVETVNQAEDRPKINFSGYLAGRLNYDYTYLANLFSESTGITIEHYMIARKIERVKELLLSDSINLTDIACKMNYSSVGHLSNQFKKVTGLTPTIFKQLRYN